MLWGTHIVYVHPYSSIPCLVRLGPQSIRQVEPSAVEVAVQLGQLVLGPLWETHVVCGCFRQSCSSRGCLCLDRWLQPTHLAEPAVCKVAHSLTLAPHTEAGHSWAGLGVGRTAAAAADASELVLGGIGVAECSSSKRSKHHHRYSHRCRTCSSNRTTSQR